MNPQILYCRIKWFWLLSRCTLPTFATLYLLRVLGTEDAVESWIPGLPESLVAFGLLVGGGFYLILWIIAEALLSMYRFPLDVRDASIMVAGFMIQMTVLALTGESLAFAAYATMYVTMAALFVCGVWLSGLALIKEMPRIARQSGRRCLKIGSAVLLGLLITGLPLVWLLPPLWSEYHEMRVLYQVMNAGVVLFSVAGTVRLLRDVSIWGQPDPLRKQYDEEWKRWAAPTVLLMIPAVVVAVMIGGIMRA